MLAPWRVRAPRDRVRRPVVHAPHVLELRRVERAGLGAELVADLANRRVLDAHRLGSGLERLVDLVDDLAKERVRAARVRPHLWEGDLRRGALLQEQPALGVEEHHREGAVADALRLAGEELVDVVLVVGAEHLVVVVEDDALVLGHEVVLRAVAFGGAVCGRAAV